MDDRLTRLGDDVASSLENARVAHGAAARVRHRLAIGERPRRMKRRIRPAAVAASLALAASIVLAIGLGAARRAGPAPERVAKTSVETPPISFVVGDPTKAQPGALHGFIAASESTPLTFSDGSELRLAPAARVRVTDLAGNGARVLVENGSLHVSVVHRADTRWAIEAGPYEVRVTGTKFVVAWDAAKSGLVVKMEEGSVVVKGCGLDDARRLGAGEELVVSCSAAAAPPSASPASPSAPDPDPSAAPAPAAKPRAVDPTRHVVALAQAGSHAEAITAADANGWDSTLAALSGPELLLLADAGRYAGKFDRAQAALEVARRRFPGTDAAASAAFELGRIAMDIRHQLAVAGDHFETYLRERPNGGLAREALGRAIEARHGAGDADRAEHLAVRYLASWPDGPHAGLARKLTGGR